MLEYDADYSYNAFGLLICKEIDSDGDNVGDQDWSYSLDGWNPRKPGVVGKEGFDVLAKFDGSSLATRYLWSDRIDDGLGRIDVGGTTEVRWTLTDFQKSVRTILNSTGGVIDSLAYDAFGNILPGETDATKRGDYAWTGREYDVETGLQYNRARWYNPTTGRWLTQDPLGFDAGDSNLYRYVSNRATMSLDPSGLDDDPALPVPNGFDWNKTLLEMKLQGMRSPGGPRYNPSNRYNRSFAESLKLVGIGTRSPAAPEKVKFDLLKAIMQRLPTSAQPIYLDARVAVIPLAPPAGTIEVVLFIEGTISQGRKKDGGTGLFFKGSIGVEVSGGMGTSIGGNSGIVHGQRNWGRPRNDGKPNASAGRTYYYEKGTGKMYGSNPPVVGSKEYEKLAITRGKISGDAAFSLPDLPTGIDGDLVGRVGISGFASAGIGKFSAGAQFDVPIGEISLKRGISLVIDQASAGLSTGMGSGARIQVYGRAYGELVIPITK